VPMVGMGGVERETPGGHTARQSPKCSELMSAVENSSDLETDPPSDALDARSSFFLPLPNKRATNCPGQPLVGAFSWRSAVPLSLPRRSTSSPAGERG
jgi:hypothetical protein